MLHKKINIGIISLGCPKNTADTEAIIGELSPAFTIANAEDAEIVLLNTCAFLKVARDEVYANLDALKNKKVILVGCMTGGITKDIFDKYPQIRAVVSSKNYTDILNIAIAVSEGKKVFAVTKEPAQFTDMKNKHLITPLSYAYVKIAEGCNNRCAFCLIPYLKGVYRSRKMESILDEIKAIVSVGVKEIVLVAQDCGYYGMDTYKKTSLADLLKKIIKIKGDFWVRVLYLYPERINEELLNVIADSQNVCKYLDIPLQHGDPEILRAMRRPFDTAKTLEKINLIKKKIPDITIRTSLIVGFPGEEKKEFENLKKFVKQIDFDHIGVFEYSREKGTPAYDLKNQVPDKTKKSRRREIMLLQQKISYAKNKRKTGKTIKTLIESYDPECKTYTGRSEKFAPEIDGNVIIKSSKKLKLNSFHKVRITNAGPYDLYGDAA